MTHAGCSHFLLIKFDKAGHAPYQVRIKPLRARAFAATLKSIAAKAPPPTLHRPFSHAHT
jgi:hypothetical protein